MVDWKKEQAKFAEQRVALLETMKPAVIESSTFTETKSHLAEYAFGLKCQLDSSIPNNPYLPPGWMPGRPVDQVLPTVVEYIDTQFATNHDAVTKCRKWKKLIAAQLSALQQTESYYLRLFVSWRWDDIGPNGDAAKFLRDFNLALNLIDVILRAQGNSAIQSAINNNKTQYNQACQRLEDLSKKWATNSEYLAEYEKTLSEYGERINEIRTDIIQTRSRLSKPPELATTILAEFLKDDLSRAMRNLVVAAGNLAAGAGNLNRNLQTADDNFIVLSSKLRSISQDLRVLPIIPEPMLQFQGEFLALWQGAPPSGIGTPQFDGIDNLPNIRALTQPQYAAYSAQVLMAAQRFDRLAQLARRAIADLQ